MTNADRIRQISDKDLAIFIMCLAEYDEEFNKSCGCNGEMNKRITEMELSNSRYINKSEVN